MTTAHRPTWHNALAGGNRSIPTEKISSQDLRSHMTLKTRQSGQSNVEDLEDKNYKKELEEREKKYFYQKKHFNPLESVAEASQIANEVGGALEDISAFPEDADDEPAVINKEESDSEVDSDEEEMELRRELEKIAKEREEEAKKKKLEEDRLNGEESREEILRGNPLLVNGDAGDNWLKRKWTDDVVFKNQAKRAPKARVSFVNDTVRSEFHKKFLSKYIV